MVSKVLFSSDCGEWTTPPGIFKHYDSIYKFTLDAAAPVVCMLLPARTDTKWFHDFCYKQHRVDLIPGRLKFGGAKNSAPFPSMVIHFLNGLPSDARMARVISSESEAGEL